MQASEAITSHRATIQEVGETILIRRAGVDVDTAVRARTTGFKPSPLLGPIVQGDVPMIVMAEALAALLPLTTNDVAIVRNKELAIKAIDDNTRRIGGTLIALEILAGG